MAYYGRDKYHLTRSTTNGVEVVAFCEDTKVLTEVPVEVFRDANEFITKFAGGTSGGGVSITFFKDSTYRLHIGNWGSKIVVSLYELVGLPLLGIWDMTEIDPFL